MTSLVHGRTIDARWLAHRDWAETLVGRKGLRLEDWLEAGAVHVVKHGPHRSVYRVAVAGREFYVKHFRCNTLWDTARHLFRLSPARREWNHAEHVAQLGIATIAPLAWQEQKGLGPVGESLLVTQAIPGACSLDAYYREHLGTPSPATGRRVWRQLLADFADFVASIHRAGIWHDDFHQSNFVVSLRDGLPQIDPVTGRFQIWLIDLPGVRFSAPLGWRAIRKNLVMLNASWFQQISSTDRYRFWRAYLAGRPDMQLGSERKAIREIAARTAVYRQWRLRRRDKRALRNNRDYLTLALPRGRAYSVRDFGPGNLRQFFDASEELLRQNLHRSVKLDGQSIIVEAELPVGGRRVHVAMKRYEPRCWWKALLAPFRQAKAVRGWHRGHAMRLRNVATARPIAAFDLRRPWFQGRSYLAVEWIEGSENLHLYLWRLAGEHPTRRFVRVKQCAEQLGTMLGRMHAESILHSDLKATNLLVAEEPDGLRTYLVDVDAVSLRSNVSLRQRAADLARLAVSIQAHPWISRTVVRRFLLAYLAQTGLAARNWKPIWRAAASRSERIVRKKRRKREAIS